jgi:hypothetical protein
MRHLRKLVEKNIKYVYIRNDGNIHVKLLANDEAAICMIESELHGMNLKMLHNNMQRYRIIRIICRKFYVVMKSAVVTWLPGFVQAW